MKTQVVDLEALVCGDRKITCETLVPDQDHHDDAVPPPPDQTQHLDYAPDSFWLSGDAEFDWFDRNAFFERKGSTRGSDLANSSAHSSQRFSMNLKKSKAAASIIRLPKSQKSYTADANTRRNHHHHHHHHQHMFPPSRREGSGKTTTLLNEPSSPKVSCIGRVRSKRDRNRRLKNRKNSSASGSESVKAEGSSKRKKKQKNRGKQSGSDEQQPEEVKTKSRKGKGLWKNLRAIFRSHGNRKKNPNKLDKTSAYGEGRSVTHDGLKEEPTAVRGGVTVVVPSLGGMTRFVSGRRSDSWVGDAEWRHERGATSGPLDKEPVWKRRDVDPPKNVHCGREWEAEEGPASV